MGAREHWPTAAAYFKCYPLPRPGWAWEFARRHPVYAATYDDAARGADDRAAAWGLLLLENPAIHARDALVLWRADAEPGMLRAAAVKGPANGHPIDLWAVVERKAVALTPAGLVVLMERDGAQFRLTVENPDGLADRMMFDLRIRSSPDHVAEVELARAFLRTLIVERERRPLVDPLAPKLARYLQALDGYLAGASYGAIGRALFAGNALLATVPGRQLLKGRTRHAVRRGLALMNGGYRQLLLPPSA